MEKWQDVEEVVAGIERAKKEKKPGQWARYLLVSPKLHDRIQEFLSVYHPNGPSTLCELKLLRSDYVENWEVR